MEAYPSSIRKKIIERYRAGESTEEIAERMGINVDLTVYCRALKKLGLTRKKSRSTPLNRIVPT
jgi:transposase